MTRQQPAGWYPDPDDESRERYWNGAEWSDNLVRVPPALRWEYTSIRDAVSPDDLMDAMNELGSEGWEAVGVIYTSILRPSDFIVLMKRPLDGP